MDEIAQAIAECLGTLLSDGFEPPLHIAGVARKGSAFVLSYEGSGNGLEPYFRLEPEGEFQLPVNTMIVDSRREAARLVIGASGERRLLH